MADFDLFKYFDHLDDQQAIKRDETCSTDALTSLTVVIARSLQAIGVRNAKTGDVLLPFDFSPLTSQL